MTQEYLTFNNAVAKAVAKEIATKDRVELQKKGQMCTKCHILTVVHEPKHRKCHLDLVRCKINVAIGVGEIITPRLNIISRISCVINPTERGHIRSNCHPERTKIVLEKHIQIKMCKLSPTTSTVR